MDKSELEAAAERREREFQEKLRAVMEAKREVEVAEALHEIRTGDVVKH